MDKKETPEKIPKTQENSKEFSGPRKSKGFSKEKEQSKKVEVKLIRKEEQKPIPASQHLQANSQQPEPAKRFSLKLFGKWSTDVIVRDPGLKDYINLKSFHVPYSAGRTVGKTFWKSKKSIIERLINKLMVAGHKGKKHYWTSGINSGKIATIYKIVKKTFENIEQRTKENPIQILVQAIETGSPMEGVATIEYGGVRYPKAVDLAPQRRVDLALRWMAQGAFVKAVRGKKPMAQALADEILAAKDNDATKSNCVKKKVELERQAQASR